MKPIIEVLRQMRQDVINDLKKKEQELNALDEVISLMEQSEHDEPINVTDNHISLFEEYTK